MITITTTSQADDTAQLLGDAIVFAGTSVPLRTLFDYLQDGRTLDTFLSDFPSVHRGQATAALQLACDVLVNGARSARPGTIRSVLPIV